MQKVIYFDEGSATDILQIEFGGELISVDEDKGTVHFGGTAEGSAEVGLGTNFFTAIKASFTAKVSAESSHNKDSLISKTISNTILSDFHKIGNRLNNTNKISIFKNFQIRAIKNSFTFMKMYTPYMKMFKEDSAFLEEVKDFDIQKFDEILKDARGYYELLAYKDKEKIILRFNINAFKNAYSLTDLPKMELIYYAVKVGESKESDLEIQNEMAVEEYKERLSASALMDNSPVTPNDNAILKMYDVILAGVEVEDN